MKPKFFAEPDYMRLSVARIAVGEFDFSKLYPRRDLEAIGKHEQQMHYITECFVKAAQREKDEDIVESSSYQNLPYQDPLPLPRAPYRPCDHNERVSPCLPHRVPLLVPDAKTTIDYILRRARASFGQVRITESDITTNNADRFIDPFDVS